MTTDGGGWTLVYSNIDQPGDLAHASLFLSDDAAGNQEIGTGSYTNSKARYSVGMNEVMFDYGLASSETTTQSIYHGTAESLLALEPGSTLAYDEASSTGRIPLFNVEGDSSPGVYNPDAVYFKQSASPNDCPNTSGFPAPHRFYAFSHYDGSCLNQAGFFCWLGEFSGDQIFGDVNAPPYENPSDGFVRIYVRRAI